MKEIFSVLRSFNSFVVGEPMLLFKFFGRHPVWFLFLFLIPLESVAQAPDIQDLLKKMESAYAEVTDYQAKMEVRTYSNDHSYKAEKFLYTFKKPKSIRLDFESPHPNMILVYPDPKGKVGVRPSGWARFIKLSLSPDSFFLKVSSGQTIDQTDMGLLIKNISKSLTDESYSRPELEEEGTTLRILVLAENHFRKGVRTRYEFFIDKTKWLPIGVSEYTPDKVLERQVIFKDLRTNIGVKDSFFQLK
jgi:outer membrane lipoprotein-sorting protein